MSSWTDKRPMSPHVQVWKWHATMWGSILHRATGCALYAGAALVAAWLFVTMTGQENYDQFAAITGSIFGQVVLFGFLLAALYHALNGVRHLFWDAGHGFNPKFASFTATLVLIIAIVGAGAIWTAAGLIPGIDPFGFAK